MRGSLTYQIQETLKQKCRFGHSKHKDKKAGIVGNYIYSFSTMKNYMTHCNYFTKYCKQEHKCRTLEECRKYVNEWLAMRDNNCSAYTVKLEASALAKLYGCKTTDFISTSSRYRKDITRSRQTSTMDSNFNESKHSDFVEFCKNTGLRRKELTKLTGDALCCKDGQYYIHVTKGAKGGKERYAPILNNNKAVIEKMRSAGSDKVFKTVYTSADIHSYRSDYATSLYKANARTLDECRKEKFVNPKTGKTSKNSVYWCREDKKGTWFDKKAMFITSQALGHNRIDVIAGHYLH